MKRASGSTESAHWLVFGRVQGVGFRWFVQRAAQGLGLRGDVRNLPDGSVEVRAEGPAEALNRLLGEVGKGPSGGQVDRVQELVADRNVRFGGFDIRF